MRAVNRRVVLLAAVCTCVFTVAAAGEPPRGCALSARDAAALDAHGIGVVAQELTFTTGDPQRDKMLGRALVRISQLFDERPGFGFVDDTRHPNAYASSDTRIPGTWGTVRFGRSLFDTLLDRYDDNGIAILAVIAHEFGHIVQFRRGVTDALNAGQKTVRRAELHADLLAGYYLGTRKMADGRVRLRTAGLELFSIGDLDFNSPDHHGTPEQRIEAAEYGYKLAQEHRTFDEAFKLGMQWILTHFTEEAGTGA